jgi:hypothetical protein
MYTILDAARIFGELYTAQALQKDFVNLYKGQPDELESVAPYLFAYNYNTEFGKWLRDNGWGKSWGIFLETTVSSEELFTHFKNFIFRKTPEGKDFFFRFYDPRVMRKFLLSYNTIQLKSFFGPIKRFFCEDEDELFALIFSFDGASLSVEKVEASILFPPTAIIKTTVQTTGKIEVATKPVAVALDSKKQGRKFFD